MVFRCYNPGTKVAIVRMSLQQHSQTFIRDALGVTVSRHSFNRWTSLFRETQRVVRDPEEYSRRGRTRLLTAEDREFMLQLIRNEPGLFLDELRKRLYDSNGTLMGLTSLHENLVRNLTITLKKANTVSIRKSLHQKFQYIAQMANVPAEFLVFTDESAICSRDLLRTFACSKRGDGANRLIRDSNAKRFSLLPAIGYYGLISLNVDEENVNAAKFEQFLKWKLLPRMNPYPGVNSILSWTMHRAHQKPRVANQK
ncbi:hypothetical protein PSHT_07458 [Puccinia striiformis]|uniref:Tc1-like transposase DDE domain-containing protein n=1 Tax=Puccinia striiformis TaxID=27350 RepID=A0A2S4VXJ7_9BASI|nr:hypothetical protein PSHT_07458 [Puccinia striiformis]